MKIAVKPKTIQQLHAVAFPSNPRQPEAMPWVLYDTQTFTSASTVTLQFFKTAQSNPSLGNMETAGVLDDPKWFEIYYIGLDIMTLVNDGGATGNVGALDDIERLLWGDAGDGSDCGIWQFEMSQKITGPFPISFLHGSGGAVGFGYGTTTADTKTHQFGNNGIFDGGFHIGGNIVIPPKRGFKVTLNWGGQITLSANRALRVWMAGVLHRAVL
jgi:hypothetical protein